MLETRELHVSAGVAHYLWRDMFVLVSGPYERFDNDPTITLLRQLTREQGRRLAIVTLVEPDSPALDEAARATIKRSLDEIGDHVACAITQISGQGLAVSVALAIASGMMMVGYRAGVVAWPSALTRSLADTAARVVKSAPSCVRGAEPAVVRDVLAAIQRRARAHFDARAAARSTA